MASKYFSPNISTTIRGYNTNIDTRPPDKAPAHTRLFVNIPLVSSPFVNFSVIIGNMTVPTAPEKKNTIFPRTDTDVYIPASEGEKKYFANITSRLDGMERLIIANITGKE